MWQKQVEINSYFEDRFKNGYKFLHQKITYKIAGIGHTHIICSSESRYGRDLIFSKKDFLRKQIGANI